MNTRSISPKSYFLYLARIEGETSKIDMKVFLKVYTTSLGVVIDAKWLRLEGDLGVVIKVGETPHNRLFIYEK